MHDGIYILYMHTYICTGAGASADRASRGDRQRLADCTHQQPRPVFTECCRRRPGRDVAIEFAALVGVCCSALQCVAVCCSVLQCVAVL